MSTQTQARPLSKAEFTRRSRENEARRAREPQATSAAYDAAARTLLVRLSSGVTVTVPARDMPGLEGATDAQLSAVRIVDGAELWWDELDVQYTLISYLARALGIVTLRDNMERAGSVKSAAKSAAARTNGAKGGRPRKAA